MYIYVYMYIYMYIYIYVYIYIMQKRWTRGGARTPETAPNTPKVTKSEISKKSLPKSIGLFDENQRVRTSLCTTPIPLRISPKIRPRRPQFWTDLYKVFRKLDFRKKFDKVSRTVQWKSMGFACPYGCLRERPKSKIFLNFRAPPAGACAQQKII